MKEATRLLRVRRSIATLSFLGCFGAESAVQAHPFRGDPVAFTQADGSLVDVYLWGDEYYARAESPDGYALLQDPVTHWICYAAAAPDGELVSSGIHYPGTSVPSAKPGVSASRLATELGRRGIAKGLRHGHARRNAKVLASQQQLWGTASAPWDVAATNRPAPKNAPPLLSAPVSGSLTGLVVLIDFSDRPSTISVEEVDKAFNAASYGDTRGSIKSWTETISYSKASVSHKVVGYMRAAYPTTHYQYGTDYAASTELMKEVFAWIESNVDLTPYAVSGALPSLAVIYAGAIISNGWATSLWPHAGAGRYTTSEGVAIRQAYLSNLGTRTPISLGTHRHELGHAVFGWPDTYDYDDDSESAGGYAQEEDLPCAPFRMWSGWVSATVINDTSQIYELAANGDTCLRYNNPTDSQEYFIIEYMKKEGWRSGAPDEGLLVWHIDDNRNRGNNSWQDMTATRHYRLSVEQADGKFDLEKNVRAGAGDLFHAGDKTRFDETTTPSSNWWSGSQSGLKLCDIGALNPTMTVNVGCGAAMGGATGTGGVSAGGASTGGSANQGGAIATGGRSVGGAATGGLTAGGSSAGGTTTGGRSTGGAATGGKAIANTGGVVVATGGAAPATGGMPATGGAGTGGANTGGQATGGATALATGGISTGGLAATGAAPTSLSLGGKLATGGATAINLGGSVATGGSLTTGTATVDDGGEAGGCSCRVPRGPDRSSVPAWCVSALAVLGLRRWRRDQPPRRRTSLDRR